MDEFLSYSTPLIWMNIQFASEEDYSRISVLLATMHSTSIQNVQQIHVAYDYAKPKINKFDLGLIIW